MGMAQTLIFSTLSGKAVYSDSARCTRMRLGEELDRDKSQVSRAVSRLMELGLVEQKEMGQLIAE